MEKAGAVFGGDFEGVFRADGPYTERLDSHAEILRRAGGRGEVEDVVDRAGIERLADVSLLKCEIRILAEVSDVFAVAGGAVVDAENEVSFTEKPIGEVGAKKSGGAGDENLHSRGSTLRNWDMQETSV